MSRLIPWWGFVAVGLFFGLSVGLLIAWPAIWWIKQETKEEKAARLLAEVKIRAVFSISEPPSPKQLLEEEDDD